MKTTPFKNVMLIDDCGFDRYLIKHILRKVNFAEEIIEMDSGTKAIRELKKFAWYPELTPEIIFLDIYMPLFDGFDFLRLYKDLPAIVRNKCQIYMLTGSNEVSDILLAGRDRNVSGFLEKPLLNELLLEEMLFSKETLLKNVA